MLLAAILAAVLPMSESVPARAQPTDSLQASVQQWAADIGAPGMTAHIVSSTGGVVEQAATGVDGSGVAVDSGTPFVWGSVSKQFAAATVTGLERDGLLDRSASVLEVLPQARGMLPDPSVSIDDLMRHTSGLPHDLSLTDDWSRRGSAIDAVARITKLDGATARGSFRYSSLNYLLFQAVIEQSTGEPYPRALEREVLEPAGATATITDVDKFSSAVPPGHAPFFWGEKPVDIGFDSAGLGYGYLAGSIKELGSYAAWRGTQLRQGEADQPEVPTGGNATYGDGLFHEVIGGEDVWWHAGAVPGYFTYVAMIPSLDRAVVLATNTYGEIEAERIAAVGRALVAQTTGAPSVELPESPAATVLGVLGALIAALLGVIAWTVAGLVGARARARPHQSRSRTRIVARIAILAGVGSALLLGTVLGVRVIAGVSLPSMWRWAPDVTLLVWVLLGAVFLASVLGIVGDLVNFRRLGRRPLT